MGVVNVTPDSFSDGGRYRSAPRAIEHALQLVRDGADILDIGGESTRPGAAPVPAAEELERVLPVIEGLAGRTAAILSIDTQRASVAEAAIRAGARIVNDVSAGRTDPALLPLVAAHPHVTVVLMHMQGDPRTMQVDPRYDDPVEDVRRHLGERAAAALAEGVARDRIWIDPGIGFGKHLPHNLALLARLGELRSLDFPIVLGTSRKSFIAKISEADRAGDPLAPERGVDPSFPAPERLGGTAATVALAVAAGAADVFRMHDVAVMREAALVARAIASARPGSSGRP